MFWPSRVVIRYKNNKINQSYSGEPGSSVSVVPGYRLDDQVIEVQSPAEARGFFL
jgi:hypothetical protein